MHTKSLLNNAGDFPIKLVIGENRGMGEKQSFFQP